MLSLEKNNREGGEKEKEKKHEERMRAQRIRWRKWLLLIMCAAGEQHAGKRTAVTHVCVQQILRVC